MSEPKKDEPPGWKEAACIVVLRLCDSGHVVWLLLAFFVLGSMWIFTRNLDSKDTLTFLKGLGSAGWQWAGWGIAVLEIPLAVWIVRKTKARGWSEVHRLREENSKARKLLKKHVQGELDLGLENPE